ncbi:MAG TPA: signal peptidase I [bacterium]|nr:signal peptidase I [bacterium]
MEIFDRLPLSIPSLILILAVVLIIARLVVRRTYAIPPTVRRSVVETLDASIFAALLSLVIITFVVQAFYIPSGSMEPTLQVDDRILVGKFNYRLGAIRRGDVIVFHYPLNPGKDFVKRVVALGGETVELRDGVVLIDGTPIPELYPTALAGGDRACTSNYGPQKVPAGHLFVLGDNRCNSEDSRFFGFVPVGNVVGKALFVYWPPQRIGLVR